MGYSTFRQAKGFVTAGYGECDPAVAAEVVNTIRQHFYLWYQEVRLFLDAVECFRVHTFCLDCNECQDTYRGVTLPREMQTVEAMWHNDWPVKLLSDWREFQTSISPECDCRLTKIDMPGAFSTIADVAPTVPTRLLVSIADPADAGKRFVLRGRDGGGAPLAHVMTLAREPQVTPFFSSIDARGGVLKDLTAGRVFLVDAGGKLYGRYEPDETVPAYRRIKITGLRDDCDVVNIRAARRYHPLYGDDDVVESDNATAFDAMARYLRLYRRADKDSASLTAEKDHLATAKALMTGERAREAGTATHGQVVVRTPVFRGKQLRRGRGRW